MISKFLAVLAFVVSASSMHIPEEDYVSDHQVRPPNQLGNVVDNIQCNDDYFGRLHGNDCKDTLQTLYDSQEGLESGAQLPVYNPLEGVYIQDNARKPLSDFPRPGL